MATLTSLGETVENLLRAKTASTMTWGSRIPQMWPYPGRSFKIALTLEGCAALPTALIARLIVLESLTRIALLSISCNDCKRIHWEMGSWCVAESHYLRCEISKRDTYVQHDASRALRPLLAPPMDPGTNSKCRDFSYKIIFHDLWILKQALREFNEYF